MIQGKAAEEAIGTEDVFTSCVVLVTQTSCDTVWEKTTEHTSARRQITENFLESYHEINEKKLSADPRPFNHCDIFPERNIVSMMW